MTRRSKSKSSQLELFSRTCPGCGGSGWRTIPNGYRGSQSGGNGRGWYDLLFQCMARAGPVIDEKTWGWVQDIFQESVPYGEPYTPAWTRRVVEILNERYEYKPRGLATVRERCQVCQARGRVTLRAYERYFLGPPKEISL
jgi:hypothetical protein